MYIPCPVVMVTFGLAEVLVNEGDNSSVCISITGELERPVAVNVSISGDSSATRSDHDFPAFTSLSFSSSAETYCISFNTTQDAIYESDETISVRLDSSGTQSAVYSAVNILDDDEGLYHIL